MTGDWKTLDLLSIRPLSRIPPPLAAHCSWCQSRSQKNSSKDLTSLKNQKHMFF